MAKYQGSGAVVWTLLAQLRRLGNEARNEDRRFRFAWRCAGLLELDDERLAVGVVGADGVFGPVFASVVVFVVFDQLDFGFGDEGCLEGRGGREAARGWRGGAGLRRGG